MEDYARLQQRNDEIWDLLQDPDLPPLDRQMLNEEMLRNTVDIVFFENLEEIRNNLEVVFLGGEQDDQSTITNASSETLGPDEFDREGMILYDGFDLADEI